MLIFIDVYDKIRDVLFITYEIIIMDLKTGDYNMGTTIEISLERILFILAKRWLVLVISVVLGATAAFGISEYIIPKRYTSSTTFYVGVPQANEVITPSALYYNRELVYTYSVIVKSESLMKNVSANLKKNYDIDYSPDQIRAMVGAGAVDNTEVLKITVTCDNAVDAATIANAIAEEAPEEISRVTNASFVSVLDTAKVPTAPSSPNTKRNVLIGILAALILSGGVCLIIEMTDTSIKDVETLEKAFDYPVLGNIPAWDDNVEKENHHNSEKIDSEK